MDTPTNPLFEQNREYARRVALSIAGRFGSFATCEAAIQDALVGLFRATLRYDPERAAQCAHGRTAQFTSYAYPYIAGAVRNGIRERQPHSRSVLQELAALEAEDLWLENLDVECADASAAAAEMLGGLGVVRLTAQSNCFEPGDDPASGSEQRDLHRRVTHHSALLPPRQREVLHLLFSESLGVTAIAHRLGVDKAQIARDFRKALTSLRYALCPELADQKPARLEARRERLRGIAGAE